MATGDGTVVSLMQMCSLQIVLIRATGMKVLMKLSLPRSQPWPTWVPLQIPGQRKPRQGNEGEQTRGALCWRWPDSKSALPPAPHRLQHTSESSEYAVQAHRMPSPSHSEPGLGEGFEQWRWVQRQSWGAPAPRQRHRAGAQHWLWGQEQPNQLGPEL